MRLKIRMKSIILLLLGLIWLIDNYSMYTSLHKNRQLIFILVVVTCLFSLIQYHETLHFIRKNTMGFVLGVVGIWIVIVAYTAWAYPSSSNSWLFLGTHWLLILLAFPILLIIKRGSITFPQFMHLVNVVSTILIGAIIIQVVVYQLSGVVFLTYFENNLIDTSTYRFFGPRLAIAGIEIFLILYNFYCVLNKNIIRVRPIGYLNVLLGTYYIITINQTRAYMLIVLGCMFLMILHQMKYKRSFIVSLSIIIIGLFVIANSGLVDIMIGSLFESTEWGGSDQAVRLGAITYYIEFFKSHPLFGFGFAEPTAYKTIVQGPFGNFYANDVGIVGYLGNFGLAGIAAFGWFLFYCVSIISNIRKHQSFEIIGCFLSYVLVYIFVSCLSLMIMDDGRILLLPLIIVFFENAQDAVASGNVSDYFELRG